MYHNCDMNTNNYRPRFRPEVYLRFLNEIDDFRVDYAITFLTLMFDAREFKGSRLEECLDQAIIATKFEESL